MAESINFRSLKIEWKVKNFFVVDNLEIQAFTLSGLKCKLLLKRCGTGKNEHFSIDMSRMNETQLNEIRTRMFIEDKNQEPLFPFEMINKSKNCLLWCKCLSELRQNAGKFLTGGVATFICEMTTEERSKGKTEREVSTQTAVSMDPLPGFECLSRDFHHLLDGKLLSDVTLKCGDRTIPAHRNILSARSEVFLAMLRSDMAESRRGVIEISDMEPPTLDQLVQYIYSGKVSELSADSAQQLYAAADKYAIHSLRTLCGSFMKDNLTEENACNFLALADAHGDKDLKDCALSFVVDTDLLQNKDNWFGFHEKHPKLAAEVLHHVYTAKLFPK